RECTPINANFKISGYSRLLAVPQMSKLFKWRSLNPAGKIYLSAGFFYCAPSEYVTAITKH
ncbi:hypothetical protein DCC62_21040, partial [candidate division KSB1 bacterium]